MNNKKLIITSLLAFGIALLVLCIQKDWIIIRSPLQINSSYQHTRIGTEKKKVAMRYWHHNKWASEQIDIMWSKDKTQALTHIIDAWLNFMDEEQIMKEKICLQSVSLAINERDAVISFDRVPFNDQSSCFEKWMWVEGLLKTIKESGLILQSIRFLVHHQELVDTHLDFSNPWPGNGLLNAK